MRVKVPEVKKCCFCLPLRYGIMMFGIINVVLSVLAVTCLVMTPEQKKTLGANGSLEVITSSSILFGILGMGVILNVVVFVGGFQKDITMLRLYTFYNILTIATALVPLTVLLTRRRFVDVSAGLLILVMQIYVTILVRSETIKLEKLLMNTEEAVRHADDDLPADAPDTVTLL